MRTEAECLIKVDEMNSLARGCPRGPERNGYVSMAADWTRLAKAAAAEASRLAT